MASCEKCWTDARGIPEEYMRLVKARTCTPEEQAGPDAKYCIGCGRRTIHQWAGVCMVPGCRMGSATNEELTQ